MSTNSTRDMIDHANLVTAMRWHLAHNHYPAVPATMLGVCLTAVELAAADEWDAEVRLPDGVTYRGAATAPVRALVEQHHLAPFVEAAATIEWVVADADGLWWSNTDGWGDLASATVFTADERSTLRLPDGGEWVPLGPAR
jgi:hypothetical protein